MKHTKRKWLKSNMKKGRNDRAWDGGESGAYAQPHPIREPAVPRLGKVRKMSRDSEIAEAGRALTQMRKERHAQWHKENMAVLGASGLEFRLTNYDETAIFQEPRRADFYPSTGRWTDCKAGKVHRGGAKAFLKWMRGAKDEQYGIL